MAKTRNPRVIFAIGFVLGIAVVLAFLGYVLNFSAQGGITIDVYLEFLAAVIGSIAVLGTFAFVYFAFNIWNVQEKLNQEQRDISELRRIINGEHEAIQVDAKKQIEQMKAILQETQKRYSSYSEVYDSLMLYNYIIQYIGSPIWEEPSAEDVESGVEPEADRIDRHISMVRLLMSMLTMERQGNIRETLAQCRDVVGHLRKTDDTVFFDFLDKRLSSIEAVNENDIDTLIQVKRRFEQKRDEAKAHELSMGRGK